MKNLTGNEWSFDDTTVHQDNPLEYRTGGAFDMNGYNNDDMSVIFEMTTMFDDDLNENQLVEDIVSKSMKRVCVRPQRYVIAKETLDNLHYIVGSNYVQCDAQGVWHEVITHYVDCKLNMVIEIDLRTNINGWYYIKFIYAEHGSNTASKINKFIDMNDIRSK